MNSVLELNNTITEMKNSMGRLNSRKRKEAVKWKKNNSNYPI